jgi:hypothetical protein
MWGEQTRGCCSKQLERPFIGTGPIWQTRVCACSRFGRFRSLQPPLFEYLLNTRMLGKGSQHSPRKAVSWASSWLLPTSWLGTQRRGTRPGGAPGHWRWEWGWGSKGEFLHKVRILWTHLQTQRQSHIKIDVSYFHAAKSIKKIILLPGPTLQVASGMNLVEIKS